MFNTIYDYRYGQDVLTEAVEMAKVRKKIEAFKKKVKKAKQIKDPAKRFSVFINELYPEYKKSAHRTGTTIALVIEWVGIFVGLIVPELGAGFLMVGFGVSIISYTQRINDAIKILTEETRFLDEKIAVAKAKGNQKELEELERLRDRIDSATAEIDERRDWK